ncbi:MAG TPA: hypothetical protein VGW57_03195 [Chthoniobacterales bacterium]|nr:hypothetical protein [Chthoniobacterales bacterium]
MAGWQGAADPLSNSGMEARAPADFRKAIAVAFWFLPVLCACYFVWRHCVALPFWDEWNTPGAQLASWCRGTFTLSELWSQHNESRKVVPRLLYLPLFLSAGWDVRLGIALVMAVACFGSVALYKLVTRTIRSAGAGALAFALMNLVLFSPRQYENFLYGIQWETFAPGFALAVALLVNLSGQSLRWKTICNGALALLSTYTFANGMLVWVLAFPLTSPSETPRTSKGWRVAYVLAAIISVGSYFISYQRPALSPPPASIPNDAPALLQFFLIWIGSVFRTPGAMAAGAVTLLLFLSLVAAAVWLTATDRRQCRSHYPWVVLGAYTLISGAATARARLGFGFEMAADARYTVFTVLLVIATIGLAFTVYENLGDRARLKIVARFSGVVAGIVLLAFWAATFTAERRILKKFTEYRNHLQLVLRWADAIPENPELAWLSPYPEMRQTIHTLAEHDVLRPRLVSATLARAVNAAPPAENASAGMLEQAVPDGNGRLSVKGWTRMPGGDRPADCVVVGLETDGRWQPRWVVGTRSSHGDFSRFLLANDVAPDGVIVKAWAVDLEAGRVYPLAGEIRLAP